MHSIVVAVTSICTPHSIVNLFKGMLPRSSYRTVVVYPTYLHFAAGIPHTSAIEDEKVARKHVQ